MSASSPFQSVTARDVAALLASTLGWEKSEELVMTVAKSLGLDPRRLSREDAVRVLEALSRQQGLVGVTARFAITRVDTLHGRHPRPDPPPAPPHDATPASGIQRTPGAPSEPPTSNVAPRRLPLSELVALIASTIGEEKAQESIAFALRLKGITDDRLTQEQALAVFEVLASHEGIVGVTARFAKARLVLRYKA
ncbi:MAG TPA: hypothetical protein VHB21_25385 [Minicystis sp.]|nr:hypothetical protein [Minicystis sp.]